MKITKQDEAIMDCDRYKEALSECTDYEDREFFIAGIKNTMLWWDNEWEDFQDYLIQYIKEGYDVYTLSQLCCLSHKTIEKALMGKTTTETAKIITCALRYG